MKRDNYKLIKENWDNFVNEEEILLREEEERIDELMTGVGFLVTAFQPLQELFKALKTIGEIFQKQKRFKIDFEMSEHIEGLIATSTSSIAALQNIQDLWDEWATKSPKLAKILIGQFALLDIVGLAGSKFIDFTMNKLNAATRKFFSLPAEQGDVSSPGEDDIDLTGMEAEPAG
tara:strand:- start:759 stop:1283 length:525 start_codon:yes stop_codon:yes gene_type:complete